jgi:hypothetical protein
MKKYNREIDWRKIEQGPKMDSPTEMRANHYQQQSPNQFVITGNK